MKKVISIIGIIIIAAFIFNSCGSNKSKSDLTSEENDFVNMCILNGCSEVYQKSVKYGSSDVTNSIADYAKEESIANMLAKYQNINWSFEFNCGQSMSFATDDSGKKIINYFIVTSKDTYFTGKCNNGNTNYEIKFTEGEVGLSKKNIEITENTKLSLNGKTYVYKNKAWGKDTK